MAHARRCVGEKVNPTLITTAMIVVSAVVLLQHTCTTEGPVYSLLHSSLITRQAAPVLSNLDASTPTKERPQRSPTPSSPGMISEIKNISTWPQGLAQSQSLNKTQDFTEFFSHAGNESQMFHMVPKTSKQPESSQILNDGNYNGTIVQPVIVETTAENHEVEVETKAVQMAKDATDSANSTVQKAEVTNRMNLNLNRSEFTIPYAVSGSKSDTVVGGNGAIEVMQPGKFESSRDANVEQISTGTETSHEENKEQSMITPWPPEAIQVYRLSTGSPIFDELQTCKKAIDGATHETADRNLDSFLYKNVTAFSKSYELMERVFKVYIYKDGSKPLVHSGPQLGIYASEGQFIERMEAASEFLTGDPSRAHMFFLPYSVYRMVAHLYVPNSRSMLPLATFIKDYVDALARRYPYWNRTKGSDHFFVSCHDWGPATARDHPTLRSNAMKVVCNADLTEEFVVGKDASLPEVYMHKPKKKAQIKLGGPGYDKRPFLAFFAGQMHGRVRPILLSYWKDKDPDIKIYEKLPSSVAKQISYVQHMKMSKYCICAAGYEVNSPRIVESIHYDCVPVIIADNFVLPFSDVLNWDAFSVTVPESDIPKLKTILNDIPEKNYRSMQISLKKIRKHFIWHEKPEKYDVFHMILHSVWMSRINRLEQIRVSSEDPF